MSTEPMTNLRRPMVVSAAERQAPPGQQTSGMQREQAFAAADRWVGFVTSDPGEWSGWHHHGDTDTYFYVLAGGIEFELGPSTPQPDLPAIRRLERELRELALKNAFGQLSDDVYRPRRDTLLAQLETARQPSATAGRVDPERAISYLTDLQSLWDAPVPEGEAYGALRYEYERRRADATAAGFGVLAALGPELVRAELADDPRTAAPLALTLAPERAELTGARAEVFERLMNGRRSRLEFAQTYEATRKRHWRERENGTFRSFGRGERT